MDQSTRLHVAAPSDRVAATGTLPDAPERRVTTQVRHTQVAKGVGPCDVLLCGDQGVHEAPEAPETHASESPSKQPPTCAGAAATGAGLTRATHKHRVAGALAGVAQGARVQLAAALAARLGLALVLDAGAAGDELEVTVALAGVAPAALDLAPTVGAAGVVGAGVVGISCEYDRPLAAKKV